ncbi:MAG: type 1 glutamine amidotransferase-like domain-containing protein [Candidatus Moranbacteria bacterium]|nr:type 1 glutamine amidotransferase-like domain-containing protein [Candidatus Moranbacteria bacterium]
MKLLLTSGGITNESIEQALLGLVGKPADETSLVFVPTASNVEPGDKSWLIDDLVRLKRIGFKIIDIADISAIDKDVWLPRVEAADILYFEGGDTYHLLKWVRQSGLGAELSGLLTNKVYVGVSAGSMITNTSLNLRVSHEIYAEGFDQTADIPALGFVDLQFLPHLNASFFPTATEEQIREVVSGVAGVTYAVDDACALRIVDGDVSVVGEGKWLTING